MSKERYYVFGVDEYANIFEGNYDTLKDLNIVLGFTNWDSVRVIKGTELITKRFVKAVEEEDKK